MRKALVALGGGTIAFVIAVMLNRGLVAIGFSIKKHPEVGSVVLTVTAAVVGVVCGVAAYLAADGESCDKAKELAAATLGSTIAIYVVVTAGAAVGAFRHVHFNTGRLVTPLVVFAAAEAIVALIKKISAAKQEKPLDPA